MQEASKVFLSIFGAIVGLAILSVIISRNSQAPQVIQAGASALSNVIRAAVDPVATASTNGNPQMNAFSAPSFQDFLYNTQQGQLMARDVYNTINQIGGYSH